MATKPHKPIRRWTVKRVVHEYYEVYEAERKATACTEPAKRAAEKLIEVGLIAQPNGVECSKWTMGRMRGQDRREAIAIITDSYAPILKEAREAHSRTLKLLCDCVLFVQGKGERPDLKEIEKAIDDFAKLEGGV